MTTHNYLKGGDFMEIILRRPVNPDQRRVSSTPTGVVEVGSDPKTHPLRKGRTRIPTIYRIAQNRDSLGRFFRDPVILKSVSDMDGRE